MAYKTFGNTWWGKAWLEAVQGPDSGNTLMKGKRYARDGFVLSIEFQEGYVVAQVQGSKSVPYEVTLKKNKFSKGQKTKIRRLIRENHYYISQLASHKLPQQLIEDLKQKRVEILPNSFDDITTSCSCSDPGIPCRHTIALLFILANEIDQNPFILFDLNSFDLMTEVKHELHVDEAENLFMEHDIVKLDSTLQRTPNDSSIENSDLFGDLSEINLSDITPMGKDIVSVLTDDPLFCTESNYKRDMEKMYAYSTRQIAIFIRVTKEKKIKYLEYAVEKVSLDLNNRLIKVVLNKKSEFIDSESPEQLILNSNAQVLEYFQQVDFDALIEHDNKTILFWYTISFAIHLTKCGAYLPQLLKDTESSYFMRWIPAMFRYEVSATFNKIATYYSEDLVEVTHDGTIYKTSPKEGFLFLTSQIIKSFISKYHREKLLVRNVDNLFFNSGKFTVKSFEDREIPNTIHLWFALFDLIHKDITPIVKIEEESEVTTLKFQILMQCKDGVIVPLKEILTNDKYREQRVDILKSISLISNFIPEIDQFLLNEEATPIFLKAESFVDRWFEAMPLLDVLNIILDIPDSLRSVNYPILTLSMKRYSPDLVIDSFMDLVKILEFKWQIKIGDKYVDPDFFFEDVRFKGGIARVAERYVSLIPREITRLYRASRKDVPKFRIMDILRLGIEGKHQGIKINIEPEVLSMFNKVLQVEKQTVPTALTGTLREYQYRGFQWLHHNSQIGVGSIIADDMGLGKTIQVITLLLKDKEMNRKHPALIVVPTSLIFNWEREFQKFAPSMNIGVFHGTKRTMPVGKDVVLTSYGVIRRDLDKLNRENWHYIILDEAQNIKNHKTQQTRYIKQLQGVIRIAMTGTPVENRLSEYWSIMDFLNSGLLGTPTSFQTEFAIPIERERNRDVLEQFLKITGPFILRRVKTDKSIIKDLPDKIMINQYCSLTPKQEKLYNNVVHNIIDDIENNYKGSTFQRKGSIFNLIIALKQVCNHPANYLKNDDHSYKISGKATMLVNLLEQILENNEKCLIFTQYKEMGFIIQSIIREHFKMDSLFLHGGLSRKKRDTIVQDFQNNNKDKIFILSLKAGGTGLNLTRASHVIHYDLWWNPAVENQATDRAYRIGQNKNVNVHRFITTGTFEEKIDRMLESKKELFNISVKQGESWISDMSNEDLKEFLSLKKK